MGGISSDPAWGGSPRDWAASIARGKILRAMESNPQRDAPYYRDDLALVHHRGFGFHADACAPGILRLLEPVRQRNGLVVEIGCGSGLLTTYLVDAGLQVVATDASDSMLNLARTHVPG